MRHVALRRDAREVSLESAVEDVRAAGEETARGRLLLPLPGVGGNGRGTASFAITDEEAELVAAPPFTDSPAMK